MDCASLLSGALLLVSTATALAETRGSILGRVLDPSGDPISNATVLVWGTQMMGTTDSSGTYTIPLVPAQSYTLDVNADNFYTKRRAVDVRTREALRVDFELEQTTEYNRTLPHEEGSADTFVAIRGQLFLGGNRVHQPYKLYYYKGTLTVNGFQIPRPEEPVIVVSDSIRRQSELIERVSSMSRSAYNAGQTDDQIVELMRKEYVASSLVESVLTYPSEVMVMFREGMRFLHPAFHPDPTLPDPMKVQRDNLRNLRDTLDSGCLIYIINDGHSVTVPPPWRDELRSAMDRLKRGELDRREATKVGMMQDVIEQLRKPITLLQVP